MAETQDNTSIIITKPEHEQISPTCPPIQDIPKNPQKKLKKMKTKHFSREGSFSSENSSENGQRSPSFLQIHPNPFSQGVFKSDQMIPLQINSNQEGCAGSPNVSKTDVLAKNVESAQKQNEVNLKVNSSTSSNITLVQEKNSNPGNTNNNANNLLKDFLTKPFPQANSASQYYLQSNGESFRKRRLLSANYEESGQFMELVTFIDNAQKTEELSHHKLIRKNSCCCMNCGAKTAKEKKVEKCLPQFKSKQAVRLMYRHAFQKTIGDVNKINKYFKQKLKIGNYNSFTREFNTGNSRRDGAGTKGQLNSPSPLLIKLSNIPLAQNGFQENNKNEKVQTKAKTPQAQSFKAAKTPSSRSNQKNAQQSRGSDRFSGHSQINTGDSTTSASRSKGRDNQQAERDQHKIFLAKITQSLRPKGADGMTDDLPKNQQVSSVQLANSNNNVCFSSEAQSVSASQTTINASNPTSNVNQVTFAPGKGGMRLDQLLLNSQGKLNQGQKDNIIDQFKQETKLGKCNNDFVISLGSQVAKQASQKQQILRQKSTISNFSKEKTIIMRQKSKQGADIPILEDYEEDHLQQQQNHNADTDMKQTNHNKIISQYFRNIPKMSHRFFYPVLTEFNRDSSNNNNKVINPSKTLNTFASQSTFDKQIFSRQESIESKGWKSSERAESQCSSRKAPSKAVSYSQLPVTQHFQEKERLLYSGESDTRNNHNKLSNFNKSQLQQQSQQGSPFLLYNSYPHDQKQQLFSIPSFDSAKSHKKRRRQFITSAQIPDKSEKSLFFETTSPQSTLQKGYRRYNTSHDYFTPSMAYTTRSTCQTEAARAKNQSNSTAKTFCSLDVYLPSSRYSQRKKQKS